jgi:hypothetical protein
MENSESEKANSSLISLNVSDVLGLGKAAEKLSPVANKVLEGVGKIIDPGLSATKVYLETRARSAAERHETKKNLLQISEVDKILASDPHLAQAMKVRLIATEMRRQANIHATAQHALKIADSLDNDSPPADIDEDFIQDWVEGVKDISNEEVQKIWATLLAVAPKLAGGRISKPALELLKQFDQPTALCFVEFVKVLTSVGHPSVKAPLNWAPFGKPIRLKLLLELGALEQQTLRAMALPSLGWIKQTRLPSSGLGLQYINSMEVFVLGQRAMELCEAIFVTPFQIDPELVHRARSENFGWLVNDDLWNSGIADTGAGEDDFRYIVTSTKSYNKRDEFVQGAIAVLNASDIIDSSWKQVLLEYAEAGRLLVPKQS